MKEEESVKFTVNHCEIFCFSISPPPKDNENSNSASSDNMEYGDLEMNLEFDCRLIKSD